ncbi:MAG: endonuclease/exonuclease/phosphatase family protein [Chitinophagaceae bacterium]|nr:MAG: endonuclease/exonuclease/phosphatase family protein [Chitinophagaceae bacterium]
MKRLLFYSILLVAGAISHDAFGQQQITAMSYNIRLDAASDGENRWDLRKDRVAGLMNYYGADFIGAQEVLHHQLTYLAQNLPGYNYIGVGRDDGKQKGEYSCIFYNSRQFKVISSATFWLSPTPQVPSKGWDAALNRVCTYGLFQHKKTKHKVWVFNTHFDHSGQQARRESAKLIVAKIAEVNRKNYPVIVTGDFNLKPEEAPVQYMCEHLQNTRSVSKLVYGNADTWNGFKFNEQPQGTIDYIFTNRHSKLSVSKFATLTDSYERKYPSDHFPVMATLQLAKR